VCFDHKIVCWGDYAIPVPCWANWMTFDSKAGDSFPDEGHVWVFEKEPEDMSDVWQAVDGKFAPVAFPRLTPPEPGRWHTQLYDIS